MQPCWVAAARRAKDLMRRPSRCLDTDILSKPKQLELTSSRSTLKVLGYRQWQPELKTFSSALSWSIASSHSSGSKQGGTARGVQTAAQRVPSQVPPPNLFETPEDSRVSALNVGGYHHLVSRGDVSSERGGGQSVCGSVSYGFSTLQGRRATLEDRVCVHMCVRGGRHLAVFGVFDGHGGPEVSEYSARHLLKYMLASPLLRQSPAAALTEAYERTDHDVIQSQEPYVSSQDNRALIGSTALTACFDISGQRLIVANIGDARAVLGKKDGSVTTLTKEHNCQREDEYERVIAAGGHVESVGGLRRVGGVLAVSRAIGDAALRPGVIATPEVYEQSLTPEDEILLLATDGLWDVMGDAAAIQAVRAAGPDSMRAASRLVEAALLSRARDDIACLVIKLHWPQTAA